MLTVNTCGTWPNFHELSVFSFAKFAHDFFLLFSWIRSVFCFLVVWWYNFSICTLTLLIRRKVDSTGGWWFCLRADRKIPSEVHPTRWASRPTCIWKCLFDSICKSLTFSCLNVILQVKDIQKCTHPIQWTWPQCRRSYCFRSFAAKLHDHIFLHLFLLNAPPEIKFQTFFSTSSTMSNSTIQFLVQDLYISGSITVHKHLKGSAN